MAERTYETQNDQRLDELHSKIRALRGVSMTEPAPSGPRLTWVLDYNRHQRRRRAPEFTARRNSASFEWPRLAHSV